MLCVLLQGYCCAAGSVCAPTHQAAWLCVPAILSPDRNRQEALLSLANATAEPTGGSATVSMMPLSIRRPPAIAAGIPKVDLLQLVVQPDDPEACNQVKITAMLLRTGSTPVARADIVFAITTESGRDSTAPLAGTVMGTTGADGTASVTIPARLCGRAGWSTVVSAYTAAARAMGVRWTIPVQSQEATVQWA